MFLSTSLLISPLSVLHLLKHTCPPQQYRQRISCEALSALFAHLHEQDVLSHVNPTGHPQICLFPALLLPICLCVVVRVSLCGMKLMMKMSVFIFPLINHPYHSPFPWTVISGHSSYTEQRGFFLGLKKMQRLPECHSNTVWRGLFPVNKRMVNLIRKGYTLQFHSIGSKLQK